MNRIATAAVTAGAIALVFITAGYPAAAQPADKVYRIGFLSAGSVEAFKPRMAAFRQGLRELGYSEGKNIVIEERYAAGRRKRLPDLAAELVGLDVDVMVTNGGTATRMADRATRRVDRAIPVVFALAPDPIGGGLVASLARPGGNVTGLSLSHDILVAKRLELLKEVVPGASRVAVLMNSNLRGHVLRLEQLRPAESRLGLTILPVEFKEPGALERAFAALKQERPDALMHFGLSEIATYQRQIAAFALENRLPSIFTIARSVELGGLMSYAASLLDLYRRAATYVDKILKGAKPADMPVELPTRFYLTVNLKTAKALVITFPPSILLRATEVIE